MLSLRRLVQVAMAGVLVALAASLSPVTPTVSCQAPCTVPGRLTGSDASSMHGSYKILFDTGFTPQEIDAMKVGLSYWPHGWEGTFDLTFDPEAEADHTIWVFLDSSLGPSTPAHAYNPNQEPGDIGVNPSFAGSNQKGANFWQWDMAHEMGHELGFGHTPGWNGQAGSYGNSVMDNPLPSNENNLPSFPSGPLSCDQVAFNGYYSEGGGGVDENESVENRNSYLEGLYLCWFDVTISDHYYWDWESQSWIYWYTEESWSDPYDCVPLE